MLRTLIASSTLIAMLTTGCSSQRPWPNHPVAAATPVLASSGAIGTIDVLPFDLQLWAEAGHAGNVDQIRSTAEAAIMNVALDALDARHYALGAMIDWNGDFAGGRALHRDDLMATLGSLARYGEAAARAAARSEHELPVPYLPARLGTVTGSDATLYVGGWSYVARPRESTGAQIAKGIGIALLVVTAVAVIAAATSSHGGHRGGGHHGGGGGAFSGGRAAHGVFSAARTTVAVADAFGRVAIDLALTAPEWADDPELPREGRDPEMYLEMTLIDNRTGLALWHAHQRFPANASKPADAARTAATLLASLPHRAPPPPPPPPFAAP